MRIRLWVTIQLVRNQGKMSVHSVGAGVCPQGTKPDRPKQSRIRNVDIEAKRPSIP